MGKTRLKDVGSLRMSVSTAAAVSSQSSVERATFCRVHFVLQYRRQVVNSWVRIALLFATTTKNVFQASTNRRGGMKFRNVGCY